MPRKQQKSPQPHKLKLQILRRQILSQRTPPSGDAVAAESPSKPVDEPALEGEAGEVPSAIAKGDEADQLQEGGEGGVGEKSDKQDGAEQARDILANHNA